MRKRILFIVPIIFIATISFIRINKSDATTKEEKEYRYIQSIDNAPKFSLDTSNKNYLLIVLKDSTGIKSDSIKLYKLNSKTKKYDKEIKTELKAEKDKTELNKKTTVKLLRENISNKSENVKIKIVAKDKNNNKLVAYFLVKPLSEEKNKKWYSYTNASRIYFSDKVECKNEEEVLTKKIKVNFEDRKGIKLVKIYDLNSNTPTEVINSVRGKTSCILDLSKYIAKKSNNGKNSCRIRFIVENTKGLKRNEIVEINVDKYERVPAASLNLNEESLEVTLGNSYKLNATITPTNTTDKITYTSANKKIATVDNSGKITPKKEGTVTIYATIGNQKRECKVTVKNARNYEDTIYFANKFRVC